MVKFWPFILRLRSGQAHSINYEKSILRRAQDDWMGENQDERRDRQFFFPIYSESFPSNYFELSLSNHPEPVEGCSHSAQPELRTLDLTKGRGGEGCPQFSLWRYRSVLLLMGLILSFIPTLIATDITEFTDSFVKNYQVSPNAKFAREYHPCLLDKTQKSVKALEHHIAQQGFNLDHRLLIMGYERNAMPRYINCLSGKSIDDEAMVRTTGGWEFAPGNLFGFLTGYLFKDCGASKIVEHVITEPIELFSSHIPLISHHAFGKWHEFIESYQQGIAPYIAQNNTGAMFNYLTSFWQSIYEAECKNAQGSSFATQDILFSLYYVKHLSASTIPVKKLFVGSDLTYPIEVTASQSSEVTRTAQAFVKRFTQELQPVNNQKTAYIFLSFVDGVGKSTLLGNVCNWKEHKENFDAYTHVSNASSQKATLYTLDDNVVIVDLPAQISHYCAKPDGAVYIDLGFCKLDASAVIRVYQHVIKQAEVLKITKQKRLAELAAGVSAQSIEDQVLSTMCALEIESVWCPFEFENQHWVFNTNDLNQVRLLTPFDQAHSQGLKIKEPELMLFDKGLHIPMRYELFLKDLTDQMAAAGVKNVVLVDFLSMYPRTSRETVRINYLLQQLKTFYHDEYAIQSSVYRTFAHYHQLYPLFFKQRDAFERSVFLETLLRWVIYDTIMQASTEDVRSLTAHEVRDRLQKKIKELYTTNKKELNTIINTVRLRVDQEAPNVEHYQYSSWYEAVSQFDVGRFVQFAETVRAIIATCHSDPIVCALFNDVTAEIDHVADQGRTVELTNHVKLDVIMRLADHIVDRPLVETAVQQARSVWYNQLVSLLVPELHPSCKQVLTVKKFSDGYYYLLRYRHKDWTDAQPRLLHEVQLFGLPFEDESDPSLMERVISSIQSNDYYKRFSQELSHLFVSTSCVCAHLDEHNLWHALLSEQRAMIAPRTEYVDQEVIRLVIRALTTLHFIMKSPNDLIMVRYGNQDDFVAALRLFEQLILPKYLNMTTKGQLFVDYTQVVPLVGEFDKKE